MIGRAGCTTPSPTRRSCLLTRFSTEPSGGRDRRQVVQRVGGRADRVRHLLRSELAPPARRHLPAKVGRPREHELLWQISLGAARHRNATEGAIPNRSAGTSARVSHTAWRSLRTRRAGHHRRARCSPGSTVMQPSTSRTCRGTPDRPGGHRGQSGRPRTGPSGRRRGIRLTARNRTTERVRSGTRLADGE